MIGDSLTAGEYTTYKGLSSYAWGLGTVEFSIAAYPSVCLIGMPCWGNPRR
ncbi:hypothetical protein K432DRAFT_458639 [Lepidopterella palustris CBS 459.81]|uniref:SGNH hydrolase-type esterase domain-containing protein n=1 Tax=Lepidopterella palustris CBS 459.81 TaxID=1314670 RepID=A0A8E2JJA0_9PEZI|nr:hypothetical protein K432DRAFT_458639 [Lepidopterella palustris CBS 459.81]